MTDSPLRYRLAVFSRCLAGIGGGFVLAQLSGVVLAFSLTGSGEEVMDAAALVGIPVFIVSLLWVFSCGNAWRAWAGIGVPLLVLGGLVWNFYGR
ncbi:MAG: DUF3649 domain-containing protein [Verrucomicrobiaceae bacterium]|nr:DUF3649 domain-containing protein [Verrucomicrobiaceae bacterium]